MVWGKAILRGFLVAALTVQQLGVLGPFPLYQGMKGTAPAYAATENLFAVLRAPDADWNFLQSRLNGYPYSVVNQAELSSDKLKLHKILFIPNVTTFTLEQVNTLQTWVDQGGRLIVSGAVGAGSPPEVHAALKKLLGVYWGGALPSSATIERGSQPDAWLNRGNFKDAVRGGTLVPVNFGNNIQAYFQKERSPAVITTPSLTYLAWEWGSGSAKSDRQWLGAALERYVPGTAAEVADAQEAKFTPISTFEALKMQKELQNLLGRVESTILTNDASATNDSLPPQYRDAAQQARKTLNDLSAMIKAGKDEEARTAWKAALDKLWANYPASQLAALPEVRAIWLDRGSLVQAGSEEGLRKIFDRLAKSGINTVFLETVNAGYTVYPSKVAPQQNPLTRWDPLRAGVKLAHERNMELHAWCWMFATGNKRHNVILNQPASFPGPVLAAYPDMAMTDRKGGLVDKHETWLDPANNKSRDYLKRVLKEIVTEYDVDGVQMDYIRYPFQKKASFGYSPTSRGRFQQLTGVDPLNIDSTKDYSLARMWREFKVEQVTSFVSEVSQELRQAKPRIILSAAVFPIERTQRLSFIQQDWETWAEQGMIDMIVPMTYSLETKELKELVEPNLMQLNNANAPVLLLPSLMVKGLTQVKLRDQLQAVRDLPSGGYSLFAVAHLNDEQQQLLTANSSASPFNPTRQPFQTVQERFKIMQKEWSLLSSGKKIWMTDADIPPFQAQALRVNESINSLVERPSPVRIQKVRQDLAQLRAGMVSWLRLEKLERPYRVQTWDNRLAALDAMLRYGELALPRLATGTEKLQASENK
jgi:uncharacterized lipoprotein YddW (UPF0748 family)